MPRTGVRQSIRLLFLPMRALIQRVQEAQVTVADQVIGRIQQGLLIFLGIAPTDQQEQASALAQKIAKLRIFPDEQGQMNLSVDQVKGGLLIISQFTLYGDCEKGNRPSFTGAAKPEWAEPLYEFFIACLKTACPDRQVQTGKFGADMRVHLVNWGPVTLWLER